jgi:hypothetical protein
MWRLSDAELNCVKHEDPPDVGVYAVAEGDVDEAVLTANRYGRLRAMLGEWKEPCAPAAAEDEREHLVVHGHSGGRWYTGSGNGSVTAV